MEPEKMLTLKISVGKSFSELLEGRPTNSTTTVYMRTTTGIFGAEIIFKTHVVRVQ
jgi:hypothetical protein